MSETDEEQDLEFLRALEDELYMETLSDGSDGSLDSELEAELYQNVHFASSLVEVPDKSIKEVEPVFSSNEQEKEMPKNTGDTVEDRPSGGNEWKIIDADLIPVEKKKSRFWCNNCNERGHRALECTEPKKEKVCWLCGGIGHLKRRCPNDLCFNCNEPGHKKKKCRKPRLRSEDVCNRCHAYGHFANICPDKWRQYHHTVEEGEIVHAKPDLSKTGDIFCYNCGIEGHFGHECLEETNGCKDRSFPFVVKYDKYTNAYARKQELKKGKKRSPGKRLDEGEDTASKRMRVEDDEVDELTNQEEQHDQIVQLTNFPHTTPNYPLQQLVSRDFDISIQNKKRKRKKKRGKKRNKDQNETTVSLGKQKNNGPNKRRRQEKSIKDAQHILDNIDAHNIPLILPADVKRNNKWIKNKKNKKGKAGNSLWLNHCKTDNTTKRELNFLPIS